ncbi:hypothetical protein [Actinomadura mexicana]|nr:hypothetical protein [Actinomadura mexicana]
MPALSHVWICASMSEVIRADRLISLFVSDGSPDNRAAETSGSGVLWAHVAGRSEPVRVDGFTGISAAELLDAVTTALYEAEHFSFFAGSAAYIRLHHTDDRRPVTSVKLYDSEGLDGEG